MSSIVAPEPGVLMALIKQGGPNARAAFDELCLRYQGMVEGSVRRKPYFRNTGLQLEEPLREFVQDAFLEYWLMSNEKKPTHIRYLVGSVDKRMLSYLKRRVSRQRSSAHPDYQNAATDIENNLIDEPLSADEQGRFRLSLESLRSLILQLPPARRQVIQLVLEGRTLDDVARMLGKTHLEHSRVIYETAVREMSALSKSDPLFKLRQEEQEACLGILDHEEREIVELKRSGLSFAEIALIMRTGSSRTSQLYHRAVTKIRSLLLDGIAFAKVVENYLSDRLFAGLADSERRIVREEFLKLSENEREALELRWKGVAFTEIQSATGLGQRSYTQAMKKLSQAIGKDLTLAPPPRNLSREATMPIWMFEGPALLRGNRLAEALSRLTDSQIQTLQFAYQGMGYGEMARKLGNLGPKGTEERFKTARKQLAMHLGLSEDEIRFAPLPEKLARAKKIVRSVFTGAKLDQVNKLIDFTARLPNRLLDFFERLDEGVTRVRLESEERLTTNAVTMRNKKLREVFSETFGSTVADMIPPLKEDAPRETPPISFADLSENLSKRLPHALQQLTDLQLSTLSLWSQGFDFNEIADQMGGTRFAAQMRKQDAIARLAAILECQPASLKRLPPPKFRANSRSVEKAALLAEQVRFLFSEDQFPNLSMALTTLTPEQLDVLDHVRQGKSLRSFRNTSYTTAHYRYVNAIRALASQLGVPEKEFANKWSSGDSFEEAS